MQTIPGNSFTRSFRVWLLPLVGLLFLEIYLLGEPSLLFPFGRDQASTAYVAHAWYVGAGVPYVGAVEIRPPANYVPYLIAEALFGYGQVGIRIIDLLFVAATALALLFIGLILDITGAALTAALVFPILYYGLFDFWYSCQMDGWQVTFICFAFVAHFRFCQKRRNTFAALAGLCLGCATLFKFTALAPTVLIAFLMALDGVVKRRTVIQIGRSLVALSVGTFVPLLLTIVYFYWHGALGAMREVLVEFLTIYVQSAGIPLSQLAKPAQAIFLERYPGFLIFLAAGALFCLVPSRPTVALGRSRILHLISQGPAALVWWLSGSIFLVILQGKYYPYHWLVCLPPATLVCAAGLVRLLEFIGGARLLVARVGLFLCVLLPLARTVESLRSEIAADRTRYHEVLGQKISAEQYYQSFVGPFHYSYIDSFQVGNYVRDHTSSDERVLVCGFEPTIYVVANRLSPTRFFNSHLLLEFQGPVTQRWRQEYYASLATATALRYVVVPKHDTALISRLERGSYPLGPEDSDLNGFRYATVAEFGALVVMRRV